LSLRDFRLIDAEINGNDSFGLIGHQTPLMAELPTAPNGVPSGDYLHRSIDQLRSLGHLTTAQLVHDYKPFNISEFRQNVAERLDYSLKNGLVQHQQQMVMEQQPHPDPQQQQQHLHHPQQQQQQHPPQLKVSYSAPNSPPTPHEQQEQKVSV